MKYLFKSHKKNKRGDTIVEVLVSLAILALVLATAYISSNHSLQQGTNAGNRNQALAYSQKQIELIKDAANSPDFSIIGSHYQQYVENGSSFCIANDGTKKTLVDIQGFCPTYILNQGPGGQYQNKVTYNNSTKLFTVQAKWPGADGNTQLQTLYYRATVAGPVVTVTLTADRINGPEPLVTTLTWTPTNADECHTAGGPWGSGNPRSKNGASETQAALLAAGSPYTFTIACSNQEYPTPVTASVQITVTPPAPQVNLCTANACQVPPAGASPTSVTINAGQSTPLTWRSVNAASCTAPWTGQTGTTGTQNVSPNVTTQYTITCSGAQSNFATVNVNQPPPPTPPPDVTLVVRTFPDANFCIAGYIDRYCDQWPQCSYFTGDAAFRGKWRCRADWASCGGNVGICRWETGRDPPPPPRDDYYGTRTDGDLSRCTQYGYVHRWTTCDQYWTITPGTGVDPVICSLYSNGVLVSSGDIYPRNGYTGQNTHGYYGWGDDTLPQLTIKCTDASSPGQVGRDCVMADGSHNYGNNKNNCPGG